MPPREEPSFRMSAKFYKAYFKTWTGEQVGYPPNGGGGGLGCESFSFKHKPIIQFFGKDSLVIRRCNQPGLYQPVWDRLPRSTNLHFAVHYVLWLCWQLHVIIFRA
jgi:hypothetical protein